MHLFLSMSLLELIEQLCFNLQGTRGRDGVNGEIGEKGIRVNIYPEFLTQL